MVVVVTGASAGVGRATVRAFARAGADVALIARGLDGLWGGYQWLDRAPKGRNESDFWWRHHDQYDQR